MHILKLLQTLNELFQHVTVHVYHLQGAGNADSSKPVSTAELLFIGSLVCSSFIFDFDYM
jgi:hypothetical protein